MKRRALLVAVAARWVASGPACADDPLDDAVAFIRDAGNRLAALKLGDAKSPAARAALATFVDATVDVDGVAQFALGRFWRRATPGQQAAYLAVFREMLAANVAARMTGYAGGAATVAIGRPSRDEAGIAVPTTVTRAGAAPVHVTWVVDSRDGRARIVDLIAEGISLRLTLRSDYAAFLSRNGGDIDALLAALRIRIAAPG